MTSKERAAAFLTAIRTAVRPGIRPSVCKARNCRSDGSAAPLTQGGPAMVDSAKMSYSSKKGATPRPMFFTYSMASAKAGASKRRPICPSAQLAASNISPVGFRPASRPAAAMLRARSAATMVVIARRNGPASTAGRASDTRCPSSSSSWAVFSTARAHSPSILEASIGSVEKAMRNTPGGRPTSSRKGRSGGGGK